MEGEPTSQERRRTGLRDLLTLGEAHAGVFTAQRARPAGVSDRMLTYYTKRGDLERVAHGIYRIARLPRHRFEDVIVACLWVGRSAAASHETALVVYGLSDAMPAAVHVSTPDPFHGKRPGVVVHHTPLASAERTVHDHVPVTTLTRTLADVAGQHIGVAHQALDDALKRGDVSLRRLRQAAAHSETSRTAAGLV